jgi:glycosyltransferase involved in cell wall biosynthesis
MKETVLFLQSEIHNYHISLIKELTTYYKFNVVVIYKDKNTKTPYVPPKLEGVEFVGKSSFTDIREIKKYIQQFNVIIARVSGWMDKDYLRISRLIKSRKVPVIACSDTQWRKELKQTIGAFLFGRHLRNTFTHIMVAGPYQFEYARKLGFTKERILFNNLSADTNTFFQESTANVLEYEKTILYVGRLSPEKGIYLLLDAWKSIIDKKGWTLKLIGNGALPVENPLENSIEYLGFLASDEISKLMKKAGFMILPSIRESWGVIMHEAALSGLPILCSNAFGSVPLFLISGYNGFTFNTGDKEDLRKYLVKMINTSDVEILQMRKNSLKLGNRITTPISAASLVSSLYNK